MTRDEIDAGLDRLDKGFMRPEITTKTAWYEIDGPCGVEYVEADMIGEIEDATVFEDADDDSPNRDVPPELADYCENRTFWTIAQIDGFGARLSAPGYLDCTDWTVFPTLEEAEAHLVEMYDDGFDDDDN